MLAALPVRCWPPITATVTPDQHTVHLFPDALLTQPNAGGTIREHEQCPIAVDGRSDGLTLGIHASRLPRTTSRSQRGRRSVSINTIEQHG
jgi:hypothetical protein